MESEKEKSKACLEKAEREIRKALEKFGLQGCPQAAFYDSRLLEPCLSCARVDDCEGLQFCGGTCWWPAGGERAGQARRQADQDLPF